MLTRCPNCGTTFRLRREQLGQAEGRVRCGKCSFAFSAVEHRIDTESTDEPFAPLPPAESDSFPPLPTAAAHFSALGQRKRFVARPDATFGESTESGDAGTATFNEPQNERSPSGAPDETPTEAVFEADTPDSTEAATGSPPEQPAEMDPAPDGSATEQMPDSGHPASTTDAAIEATGDLPAQVAVTDIDAAGTLTESVYDGRADEAEAQAESASGVDYLASAEPARRWPWMAGTLLLGFALLLQVTFAFRTDLAKNHPTWRPALEAACGFACTVDLPRDAERVSIESSDLNPESDKKHLQLAATLKNRAPYPQSYPHLELTLTDVRDQPLVRRVFAPADYLAKDAPPSFAPNAEAVVKLMLEIDDVNASGYRVYLFYP